VLVNNEGLAILSLLKIQSVPFGNIGESSGDEMNMHMPQNVLAETELRHLAAIPYQIVSPSSNAPIIGIYQDSLLGSYRFTRPGIKFSPRDAMNLLMMYQNVDVEAFKNKKEITNFEVISQILPPMTISYKTKLFEEGEDYGTSNNVLEIRKGKYVRGQMEKSVLGGSSKGMIHRVYNDFGNMAASDFIDNLQNIITEYMKSSSFSVGISDLIADKETAKKIIQAIDIQKLEVQSLINKVHLGIFENNTASSNNAEFETQVGNLLNEATNQAGKKARESLSKDNRFLMIVNSGSKGTLINISQMISCLGQQNVDGKRIPYGFDSRTLPHYNKFDDSPKARGFIENSYISGLTAPELFFHAMGGRIGLIDTAVKTSQTGYIQRRLIKGLEDIKIEYDMTVRNSKGKIIQFAYGDDGIDTVKVEEQAIPLVGMSLEDIYMHYDIPGVNSKETGLLEIYSKGTIARMKKQREETKTICQHYIDTLIKARENLVEKLFKNRDENNVRIPVAFQYVIANIQGQLGLTANSVVDITPLETFKIIEQYYDKLTRSHYAAPTYLFEIMYFYYLSPRNLLIAKRFNRKALTLLLETIELKYKQSIVHPGEMVGVIAGQSIGEPTTQLTLNSVTYETEIIVRNSNKSILKLQIGDFITNHIAKSKMIDYNEEKDTTYAEMSEIYEVPSATENGETVWRKIEAVTQHPVINEDGTNTMLKFVTDGSREIIVTKAKSLLQLVDGKIVPANGDSFTVGQYLPVSRKPLEYIKKTHLDLRTILPPSKYVYGSELEKAKTVISEHHWRSKHSEKTFILPHSRSDSVVTLISDKVRPGRKTKTSCNIKCDCVYMKLTNICHYTIPENIPLDYEFGYLIGAYCAEGCMTRHQISISNNDDEYLKPIQSWCEKHNITTKIYTQKNKIQEGWTSQDIRIYNTLLCDIISSLCGKLSHNKFVSDAILFSNDECIMGFLDAYIGGDGCIHQHAKIDGSMRSDCISATSVSLTLLANIQVMLKNIGITSKISKPKKIETNNRGSLNIKQAYLLKITNKQAQKLANKLHLSVESKHHKLIQLLDETFLYDYNRADTFVPNLVDGKIIMEERNGRFSDLEFDKIISITEVKNTTKYAYDLTVEETRNFDCANGLCLRDTFHLAGVASKSNVTRGVPRIEEILRLTKNPKNPSLTVHLKPLDEPEKDKAILFANMMEHTKLVDVVKSIKICFDPNERSSLIDEDWLLMEQYYEFENFMKECNEDDDEDAPPKSKWIIRMELDAELLLDKNITTDDIHFAIKNSYHGKDITCVYSDYNMDKLVFRIRMNSSVFAKNRNRIKVKGVLDSLDQSDEIYMLKNFQDTLLNNIVLRGINGIANVIPRRLQNMVVKDESKYTRKDVWVLDTTGSNLLETLALDFIDNTRTYSNDIKEVFDVLGIEAARQIIYNEMNDVMEFSGGVYINYHHLSLLCDRMTCNKDMVSIFRSGILNDDIGPIAKGTFEVHTEVFLDAARHGEFDHMRGVSANVMCGQFGYYGTNAFNVVLDLQEMAKLGEANVNTTTASEELDKLQGKKLEETGVCGKDKLTFKTNISNINGNNTTGCDDEYNMGF
jgi:DNA-directed RNA polymerase beta' subunit